MTKSLASRVRPWRTVYGSYGQTLTLGLVCAAAAAGFTVRLDWQGALAFFLISTALFVSASRIGVRVDHGVVTVTESFGLRMNRFDVRTIADVIVVSPKFLNYRCVGLVFRSGDTVKVRSLAQHRLASEARLARLAYELAASVALEARLVGDGH